MAVAGEERSLVTSKIRQMNVGVEWIVIRVRNRSFVSTFVVRHKTGKKQKRGLRKLRMNRGNTYRPQSKAPRHAAVAI
jgi:hypothetical protein